MYLDSYYRAFISGTQVLSFFRETVGILKSLNAPEPHLTIRTQRLVFLLILNGREPRKFWLIMSFMSYMSSYDHYSFSLRLTF